MFHPTKRPDSFQYGKDFTITERHDKSEPLAATKATIEIIQ